MTGAPGSAEARAAIEGLLASRDRGKTICPSDAARALGGDEGFRPLMDTVRGAAQELVDEGRLVVTQKGREVELGSVKGPVRLGAIGALAARQRQDDGDPPAAGQAGRERRMSGRSSRSRR
jgi:hypothetical protein